MAVVPHVVVDTNVPIVANNKVQPRLSPQASLECIDNCINRLVEIMDNQVIVLDSDGYILEEYMRYLSLSGQPGIGDRFVRWVMNNQGNAKHSVFVDITQISEYEFAEFPNDPELVNFDKSDRKWVAVAITHPNKPPILQAVDAEKWRIYESAFARHGITIEFVCK